MDFNFSFAPFFAPAGFVISFNTKELSTFDSKSVVFDHLNDLSCSFSVFMPGSHCQSRVCRFSRPTDRSRSFTPVLEPGHMVTVSFACFQAPVTLSRLF